MSNESVQRKVQRKTRIPGEMTDIKFFMLLSPSEYLELREWAAEEGESMAQCVRAALRVRFKLRNPGKLPFGARFREDLKGI